MNQKHRPREAAAERATPPALVFPIKPTDLLWSEALGGQEGIVEAGWKELEKEYLANGASADFREELRMVFFLGADLVFHMLTMRGRPGDPPPSQEQVMKMIFNTMSLRRELDAFVKGYSETSDAER